MKIPGAYWTELLGSNHRGFPWILHSEWVDHAELYNKRDLVLCACEFRSSHADSNSLNVSYFVKLFSYWL